MIRVGLFGGSFDPVHNGHLKIAESFLKSKVIDRLLILPAPNPPHKPGQVQASFEQRVEMLRLAFGESGDILISDIEKRLSAESIEKRTAISLPDDLVGFLGEDHSGEPTVANSGDKPDVEEIHPIIHSTESGENNSTIEAGALISENEEEHFSRPSYTIETITFLQERFPKALFYLCVGGDSLISFHTWVRWEEILERVTLLVAGRPGADHSGIRTEILEKAIIADHEPVDVSSTGVRNQIKDFSNTSGSADLPDAVQRYIRENGLYEG